MATGRWFSFSDCLRKKLTVIGIIGKTQGVTSEIAPQKMPERINASNPEPSGLPGAAAVAGAAPDASGPAAGGGTTLMGGAVGERSVRSAAGATGGLALTSNS